MSTGTSPGVPEFCALETKEKPKAHPIEVPPMPNQQTALDKIQAACKALDESRQALSAALIERANDEGKRNGDYAALQDLHRRVSQAATLLPRGSVVR